MSDVPIQKFQDRLGLSFNTYLRSVARYSSTVGTLNDLFNETAPEKVLDAGTFNTTSETTYFLPATYILNKTWIAIYFAPVGAAGVIRTRRWYV